MRRNFALWVAVMLIVVAGAQSGRFFAQEVVEPADVVSPTYVAVPPPQQEVITAAPAPSFVWVPGQWQRTPDKWTWMAGNWVQPPFSNAYWVPGYWQHRGGNYQWETGHWAASSQGVIVAKPVTVPPLYVEAQPAAPAATGYAWQPGYWEWRGTWVWIPGQYIQTVSPAAVWVPGAWVAAVDGTWHWNPAHWAVS
jgi:hypothetical protein